MLNFEMYFSSFFHFVKKNPEEQNRLRESEIVEICNVMLLGGCVAS